MGGQSPGEITKETSRSCFTLNIQAVHTWFKNNKPYKDRSVFKLERKISIRRVIGKLKADEIHEMITAAAPDIEKGDKSYPGHFQKSSTALIKNLSMEEMEEVEGIHDKWQSDGPPLDVRLKCVSIFNCFCHV